MFLPRDEVVMFELSSPSIGSSISTTMGFTLKSWGPLHSSVSHVTHSSSSFTIAGQGPQSVTTGRLERVEREGLYSNRGERERERVGRSGLSWREVDGVSVEQGQEWFRTVKQNSEQEI